MANALYGKGRQKFLEGAIAVLSNTIKISLVASAAYTPSVNVDEFYSDIPSVLADSGSLSTKTSTLGVFDADDVTWSAVTTGSIGDFVVGWKSTGTGSTSPLLWIWDTATGLPVTTNGGDITASFDSGSNKIFKLFESLKDEERAWAQGLAARGKGWLVFMLLADIARGTRRRLDWARNPFIGDRGVELALHVPRLRLTQGQPARPAFSL